MANFDLKFWRQVTACVPLAPGESRGAGLKAALKRLPLGRLFWGWPAQTGRAAQLNAMALAARTRYLWQVHADSTPDPGSPSVLAASVEAHSDDLHYLRLRFAADGPILARLNASLANWRSKAFGLPFGDQSLLLPREAFLRAGAYDEGLERGEDLDFVVRASRAGLRLRDVPAFMETSARRYAREGWLRTTARHLGLTAALTLRARLRPAPALGLRPALAAFVKTPGHSRIKTRLAADLGKRNAAGLYEASLALVGDLLRRAGDSGLYHPIWNVAEEQALADRRWRNLERRWAGPGSLAESLHQSYASLLKAHGAAAFIGADAPQLSIRDLLHSYQALLRHDFVLIPALDGGYALFAGRRPLPRELWLRVPLSQSDTCQRFVHALRRHGSVQLLEPMADLDRASDLPELLRGLFQAVQETGSPRMAGLARNFRMAAPRAFQSPAGKHPLSGQMDFAATTF